MMTCTNCREAYADGRFCSICGTELVEVDADIQPSVTDADVPEDLKDKKEAPSENGCKHCGEKILPGEKFCIKCGMPAAETTEEDIPAQPDTPMQTALVQAFRTNKLLQFVWKCAPVLALYYPIYLLAVRLNIGADLLQILSYVSVIGFYGYYAGIIASYAKKDYLIVLIALALRIVNSAISVISNEAVIPRLCELIIVAAVFAFVFKKFKGTKLYTKIKKAIFKTDNT